MELYKRYIVLDFSQVYKHNLTPDSRIRIFCLAMFMDGLEGKDDSCYNASL